MKNAPALALFGLVTLCACDQRPENIPAPPNEKVNAGSPSTQSTSDTPVGQADAEDPKTGMNNARPDSPKDLQPGTDGNTNPAPR